MSLVALKERRLRGKMGLFRGRSPTHIRRRSIVIDLSTPKVSKHVIDLTTATPTSARRNNIRRSARNSNASLEKSNVIDLTAETPTKARRSITRGSVRNKIKNLETYTPTENQHRSRVVINLVSPTPRKTPRVVDLVTPTTKTRGTKRNNSVIILVTPTPRRNKTRLNSNLVTPTPPIESSKSSQRKGFPLYHAKPPGDYISRPVVKALEFLIFNKNHVQGLGKKQSRNSKSISIALRIIDRYLQSTGKPLLPDGVINKNLTMNAIKAELSPSAYFLMCQFAKIAADGKGIAEMLANMFAPGLTGREDTRDKVAKLIKVFTVLPEHISSETRKQEDEFPTLGPKVEQIVDLILAPGRPENMALITGFKIRITCGDIVTLRIGKWLNDYIINFYLQMIQLRGEKKGQTKIHVFPTHFYTKLNSSGYQAVRRWTKHVNIFEKKFLFIPVHLGNHWTLCVVDITKQEIKYYDSLGRNGDNVLLKVKQYLNDEYKDKQNRPSWFLWKLTNMKDIPHQTNDSDCGVFVCQYADYISLNKKLTFRQKNIPYLRRKMVYEIITGQLLTK